MPRQPRPPSTDADLDVRGAVPSGLSGRLTGVGGDALVHSLTLHGGRVSYRARPVRAAAAVRELIAVDGSALAVTGEAAVVELNPATGRSRPIDLTGPGGPPVAGPRLDPATGELHLVARSPGGDHVPVIVPAGRLPRRSRPLAGARGDVKGLALSRDDLVVVTDGALGVVRRAGEAPITWIPTGAVAPAPVQTYRDGDALVLLVLTPSLERWVLRPDSPRMEREVLDAAPRRFARVATGGIPGPLWTTGGHTIGRHDLVGPRSTHRNVSPALAGDFALVPDAARPGAADGWFVGFFHDTTAGTTELRVIDVADPTGPAIAAVTLPRHLAPRTRWAWTPEDGRPPTDP